MTGVGKNETSWVQYLVDGKAKYIITSNHIRDTYYLYEVIDSKAVKTKYKSNNPLELYENMD